MRSIRSTRFFAVLAFLLTLSTACSSDPALTRSGLQSQLQKTDSVWARAVSAPYQGALSAYKDATVNRQYLAYDPATRKLTGTADILFTNTTDHPLPTLYMRTMAKAWGPAGADAFAMNDLKVNGKSNDFTVGQTLVTIPLAQPLQPGASAYLSYTAAVTLPEFSLQGGQNSQTGNWGLYGAGPDVTTLGGFPVLLRNGEEGKETDEIPAGENPDSGQYNLHEIWLTVPADWSVIAVGTELDETPPKDGKKTAHIAAVGGRLGVMVSNSVVRHTRKVGDLEVSLYVPAFYAPFSDVLMKNAADAIATYQKVYGPPPVPKLDVVPMPLRGASGAYWAGVLSIATTAVGDTKSLPPGNVPAALLPLVATDQRAYLREVIFHEVSHAWWGGVVISDGGPLAGYPEALANASALYALDQNDGVEAGNYARTKYAGIYGKRRLLGMPDAPLNLPEEQYRDPAQISTLTYYKASLFYDQVRKQVGDEKFFAAVRTFFSKHAFELVPGPGPVTELMAEPGVEALYRRWVEEAHGDEDMGVLKVEDPALRKLLGLPVK
jgi:hypothetical protein